MRVLREETVGLIIDVQERLVPVIAKSDEVVKQISRLIKGLDILEVPLLITQQYPHGLGETVTEIKEAMNQFTPLEKMSFSCVDEHSVEKEIRDIHKRDVIIAGIESHICVMQTAIDLKNKGFRPIVVVDAVGSRKALDKEIALKRLEQEGVTFATVESILFELCRFSGNKKFKEISKLIK